jgi:hypothetical protein
VLILHGAVGGSPLYRETYGFSIFVISAYSKSTIANLTVIWLGAIAHATRTNCSSLAMVLQSDIDSGYQEYPLYAAGLSSFIYSKGTAEKCLDRNWCSPVGGMSVYSTFTSRDELADKKTIVLAVAISSRLFFRELSGSDIENDRRVLSA